MFCEKCGKMNPDGAAFCDGCGTPMPQMQASNPAPMNSQPSPYASAPQPGAFNPTPQPGDFNPTPQPGGFNEAPQPGMYNASPQEGFNSPSVPSYIPDSSMGFGAPESGSGANGEAKKKMLVMIGAAVAAVIVLVLIFSLFVCGSGSGRGSYEDVVEDYIGSIEDGDIDKMLSLLPEFYSEKLEEDSGNYKMAEKSFEMMADMIDSVEYVIEETEKYDAENIKNFQENLNEQLMNAGSDFDPIIVEEVVKVKVKMTMIPDDDYAALMAAGGGSATESTSVKVFKNADDGNWYLAEMNDFGF